MRYHPFFLAWKKERNRAFFVFSASRKIQAWRWGPSSATTSLFLGSEMSQPPPPPPRQPLPSSPQTDYYFFLPTTDWDGHLREALLYFVFKKKQNKSIQAHAWPRSRGSVLAHRRLGSYCPAGVGIPRRVIATPFPFSSCNALLSRSLFRE
jgi:hypothetical protein